MAWIDDLTNADIEMSCYAKELRRKGMKGMPVLEIHYYVEEDGIRKRIVYKRTKEKTVYCKDSVIDD